LTSVFLAYCNKEGLQSLEFGLGSFSLVKVVFCELLVVFYYVGFGDVDAHATKLVDSGGKSKASKLVECL
jgi:hypothetical protein